MIFLIRFLLLLTISKSTRSINIKCACNTDTYYFPQDICAKKNYLRQDVDIAKNYLL